MPNNFLKEREERILKLIAKNYTNKKIAEEIHISVHTVKANITTLFQKLNARSRTEAIVNAIKLGYLELI